MWALERPFNCLKIKINLNYIQKFSSYLTENASRVSTKTEVLMFYVEKKMLRV
jgi:hypothetical protein